jgi:MerR family transcriptional regulator, redox-sensitive transcriptional activator SoxR
VNPASLAAIRDALATLPPDRLRGIADWRRLSESWRDELDDRIARLDRLRDRLDGCIGCGCPSLEHCPLRNPDDRLAQEGPGAAMLER